MPYTPEFRKTLNHCRKHNLFLGFGNPNAKILILGKEQAYNNKAIVGTPEFIKEILVNREKENEKNIKGWEKNLEENTIPDWDNMPEWHQILPDSINPFYNWGSQLNRPNRDKNGGTSNTYLKYQKFYQFLNGTGKSEKINFLKDFFISELNDVPTKYSYPDKALREIRQKSIEERKVLFEDSFFKKFPITIIAAGHYPRDYGFDIQKIFEVDFNESKTEGKDWYNIHFSNDRKRIVIHTRQLSMNVTDNLLEKIAGECHSYFK